MAAGPSVSTRAHAPRRTRALPRADGCGVSQGRSRSGVRPIAITILLTLGASLAAAQPSGRGALPTPDDSVIAREALPRARELAGTGNAALALSVLQDLLDKEGERLLPINAEGTLFVPVRRHVHELLLADADLLARYRTAESARAQQHLEAGDFASVERTRLFTPAGCEAVLRLAQLELEAGRFDSARLMLQQLERHPDRSGAVAQAAARLARQIADHLRRPDAEAWAARWAAGEPLPSGPGVTIGRALNAPSRSALSGYLDAPAPEQPGAPLQSVALGDPRTRPPEEAESRIDAGRWILPSTVGDLVLVNDGVRIAAFDQATLALAWDRRVTPASADLLAEVGSLRPGELEDVSAVSAWGGVAVAATGVPIAGSRVGDRRLHAIDLHTGDPLWSIDPSWIDRRLDNASIRGPVAIDEGTAVVALRRLGMFRRQTQLFLVGLNLYTGEPRWVRTAGTVGTLPWGRVVARVEGSVIHQGVVYRGDDMGILAAYEVASGRPVWVRLLRSRSVFDPIYRGAGEVLPREMLTPVVVDDQILYLEPGLPRLLRLSASDGAIIGTRDAATLGNPRYLLRAGRHLAAVSTDALALVPLAEIDAAPVRMAPSFDSPMAGRVVAAGSSLIVPLESGLHVLDPESPDTMRLLPTSNSGNVAVATGQAAGSLLVVSGDALSNYLPWSRAEAVLAARSASSPRNPAPLLTYLDLATRSSNSAKAPELADRVLALADADPVSRESILARQRLFELLASITASSRRAWGRADEAPAPGAFAPPPVRDMALLGTLIDRLGKAAEGAAPRAYYLLERAWHDEMVREPVRAVEAYQSIIADPLFEDVTLAGARKAAALPDEAARDIPVGVEAASRLRDLLTRAGPNAYRAFDDEAAAALAALPANAPPEPLIALARRYPVASIAPELWRRAGMALLAAERHAEARLALGSGLRAAESSLAMGRPDQLGIVARLAADLATLRDRPAMGEPIYRMLRRLQAAYPTIMLPMPAGSTPPDRLAAEIARALASRASLPLVSATPGPGVDTLETWAPLEPILSARPGISRDSVVMISEVHRQVALFAVGAEDGSLAPVWSRPFDTPPLVLRLTPDASLLYWTTPTGGYAESIDAATGRSRWRTPDASELFDRPGLRPEDEIPQLFTPLDGRVRSTDLLLVADESTLVICQRDARAAAFDLAEGQRLWLGRVNLDVVFEVEICAGHLIAAGAADVAAGRPTPAVHTFATRTGLKAASIDPGRIADHPRWIRSAGDEGILATADAILRFSPATGEVRWAVSTIDTVRTVSGWVAGDDLYALGPDDAIVRIDMRQPRPAPERIDTRGRASLPLRGVVSGDTLALTSQLGVLIYRKGALVGADAPRTFARALPPGAAQGLFVLAESADDPANPDAPIISLISIDAESARIQSTRRVLAPESPQHLTLLDGKILVTTGPATLVIDAPR